MNKRDAIIYTRAASGGWGRAAEIVGRLLRVAELNENADKCVLAETVPECSWLRSSAMDVLAAVVDEHVDIIVPDVLDISSSGIALMNFVQVVEDRGAALYELDGTSLQRVRPENIEARFNWYPSVTRE